MPTIGIADTTFARVDMATPAIQAIRKTDPKIKIQRYTVPGFKDLPVACLRLLKTCDIVLALGWVGGEKIDEVCAHEASLGLIAVQLQTGKHVLSAFVHTSESPGNEKRLQEIALDRAVKHAKNCVELLRGPTALTAHAGTGRRQGGKDAGALPFKSRDRKK